MNTLHLGRKLGDVSTPTFQQHYQHQLVQSLEHHNSINFGYDRPSSPTVTDASTNVKQVAHKAGTNCLVIDPQQGRILVSGGADSSIRLWDLESQPSAVSTSTSPASISYSPAATVTRANQASHSHTLTSISIYPFDPIPTTLLTTSYDKTILLSQLSPSSIVPLLKFNLDFTPYTHALSQIPSATPLVAIGTSHPAVRLLDLRSGLSTHSLPGHNSAVYALTFHPRHEHLLISGGADNRILLFDIRRANPAFASLDLDDAIGYPSSTSVSNPAESRPINQHLNFAAQAHTGPITGLAIPASDPSKLISAGHDQRIRLWDLPTGRSELVHFGPRIRNTRQGNLTPLLSPPGTGKRGQELLFWPNDDGRGEIHVHGMREGNLVRVMRTKGIDRSNTVSNSSSGTRRGRVGHGSRGGAGSSDAIGKLTTGGRINGLVCRVNAESGGGLEMYSAHGDGRICAWFPRMPEEGRASGGENEDDIEVRVPEGEGQGRGNDTDTDAALDAEQSRKKRKRDLIGDLVQGLTKRPVTFS